jgi:hypothetical protein
MVLIQKSVLSGRLVLKENEILLNKGSGISLEGSAFRLSIDGENVIAENKSGFALRLNSKGLRFLASLHPNSRGGSYWDSDNDDAVNASVLKGRIGGEWSEN